jgi:hypothetical protein
MASQQQQQQQELGLQDPCGPTVWEAAAAHKGDIPAEAWEYQMRKALNDAAFNNLAYEPYCPHMPTHHKDCPHPVFAWVRHLCIAPRLCLQIKNAWSFALHLELVLFGRAKVSRSSRFVPRPLHAETQVMRSCCHQAEVAF